MPTFAFCPTSDGEFPGARGFVLKDAPHIVPAAPSNVPYVAHTAAALAKTADALVLVLSGSACVHAPALGFSRRALRRPCLGYLLINPELPQVGGDYSDWPDAPINVLVTDENFDASALSQIRLRGWKLHSGTIQEALDSF